MIRWVLAMLVTSVLPWNALAEAPASGESPVVARARWIMESMTATSYVHSSTIDEKAGIFHTDCSGLVSWVLKKELPAHYKAVTYPSKYKHPRACEYYDAFAAAPKKPEAGKRWQIVKHVADAQPGDLKKDPVPPTGNTGHIVVVDSVPKKVAEGIYAVVVIDSTTAAHQGDTRKKGETGVGRGTIFVRVNEAGAAVSHAGKSENGPWVTEPMAIGRVVRK